MRIPSIAAALSLALALAASGAAAQTACPEPAPVAAPQAATPLHRAIRSLHVAQARRLMTPATIDAPDGFGDPPLVASLRTGAAREPAGLGSPRARRAAIAREVEARAAIARDLVAAGASVRKAGALGATPLIALAQSDFPAAADLDLARRLVARGADVDARDDFGSTALIVAARRGKTGLADYLRGQGADTTLRNCRGESAAAP